MQVRFLHILIVLILIFFCHDFVFAQSARSSAIKDNVVQTAAGLSGVAAGYYMGESNCPACYSDGVNCPACFTGVMMGLSSMGTLGSAAGNTKPSANALAPGNVSGPCDTDPSLCNSNNTNLNIPDPLNDPIVDQFRSLANSQGVNIDDPASVSKFMQDHADVLNSAGGGANMQMPASVQAKIEKYQKYLASKYKVSAVDLESGGGGKGFYGSHKSGSKDFDFNTLLEGINKKDQIDPSAAGLQRKLASGEPVGVAGDNIFKQITRRYQVKIHEKLFLAAPKK